MLSRVAIVVAVVGAVIAGPSSASAQTTALFFDSQLGDYIGAGAQHTYTPATGTFSAGVNYKNGVSVSVDGGFSSYWWYLDFGASDSVPLQVGSYVAATRFGFTPFNGLDVGGSGRGCNTITGRFLVREIVYGANNTVQRFAVDFEQHCEDSDAALFGALRYNSTVSSLVPFDGAYPSYQLHIDPPLHGSVSGGDLDCSNASGGPVCDVTFSTASTVTLRATPDPGYLFAGWTQPCHGALTITVKVNMDKRCSALFQPMNTSQPETLLFWNSQAGDYVGQGRREVYSLANSRWTFSTTNGNAIALHIESDEDEWSGYWWLNFRAPTGATLTTGTYSAVRFSSGSQASIDVYGNGRGCNNIEGSFTIFELTITDGAITRLALDFEQNCEGVVIPGRPLRGSIRYNSLVPPRPTLAVTTTGNGAQLTLSPPGTSCVGRCAETYTVGTSVQLTPTPTGATFSSWGGDVDCEDGIITVNAPIGCTATFVAATVAAASVTPSTGSGSTQTFALQYTDSVGATDLATTWVWFNATFGSSAANSCLLYYNRATATLFLLNDGQSWMPGTLLSGGTLQNSQCSVNLSASSAVLSGNNLTLNLAMTFTPRYAGVKNIYMYAQNATGVSSGWQARGTWTVPTAPAPSVTADSVTPNSGTGATQTFALQYSDTVGATDLTTVWVWFNATLAGSSANSCMLFYTRATNTLSLLNDGSTWMPAAIGSATTLQNSQCGVDLGASSVTMSGDTLTLTLAMTFTASYAGAKNLYMFAANGGGLTSGWQDRGDWTVPQGVVPGVTADSVTPNSGTGATQTFALQYSDTLGATDLSTMWVWFNETFAGSSANSCMLFYARATNTLSLLGNSSVWMPGTIGSAATLQNSQCGVNLGASSVLTNANTLTLTLAMTFTTSYAGAKNIYMYAANGSGLTSGWQDRGDWTVPQGVVPGVTADSVSPSNGGGATQTFALQYTDSLGASDMRTAWVWFNGTFATSAANSCLVYYDRAFNTLFLLDDAGSVWMAATLGASTTLQNGRCAISVGSSTATLAGNTLTVNLAMTFGGSFHGTTQNIYMFGAGSSMNSGWQVRGTFNIP